MDGVARPRQPLPMSDRRHKVSVLVVDDNTPFRQAARQLLERRGYLVVGEAGCCASALELADRLRPDAVLLDVLLPDGTGFLVSSVLTIEDPGRAVLLMTADENFETYGLVGPSGARGLVAKRELGATDLERFWPAP